MTLKKLLRRILLALAFLLLLSVIGIGLFAYKAKNGFPSYETAKPNVTINEDQVAILLFSKTTAFRHGAAISSAKQMFDSLARAKNWFLYETEEGGIFNEEQLQAFDLVIWNNSTGPVLNDDQRAVFEKYLLNGGGYLGIHGSGDFSHKWSFYTDSIICADFSHHPIKNQIQKATIYLDDEVDSTWTIPPVWAHEDEWYVFHNNPQEKGAEILYWLDGNKIDPSGNLLFIRDKDFGMGSKHPVAWSKNLGEGKVFYTSIGHTAVTFTNKNVINMMITAVENTRRKDPGIEEATDGESSVD